ncbi:MAG: hypothetical protein KJS45_11555, partial [Bacteroidetes bacterium]|nr:hypothetical protein [Bacteroidota bacterium]
MKTTTTLTLQAQRLIIIVLTTMLYVMSSVGVVKAQASYSICASHTGSGNQYLTELNNIFLCNTADTIKLTINGSDISTNNALTIVLNTTYFSLIGSSLNNCTLSSITNEIS